MTRGAAIDMPADLDKVIVTPEEMADLLGPYLADPRGFSRGQATSRPPPQASRFSTQAVRRWALATRVSAD